MPHPFIEHLKEDHEKQRSLNERLVQEDVAEERQSLAEEVHEETYPHMIGEEASIFPFMQQAGEEEAKEHALEAIQEHHVAKILLRELRDLSPASEVFKAKASVLNELHRHHTEEEETTHFPWLEANASKAELDGLFRVYETAEEAAKPR